MQNMDQWTMRQSSLELQLMIKQSTNNVSVICLFWGVFKKRKENNIIVGFLLSGISDYFLSVFL